MQGPTDRLPAGPSLETNSLDVLPGRVQSALIGIGVTRTWREGQVLHWAGDRPEYAFVVQKGEVRICSDDPPGNESILSWIDSGMMGMLAPVLACKPFNFNVVAGGTCEVLHLQRDRLIELIQCDPPTALAIVLMLSERLNFVLETYGIKIHQSLADRVWSRLSRLARRTKTSDADVIADLEVTHMDLARAVGASRYRVGLELKRLEQIGVIELARGRIRILRARVG